METDKAYWYTSQLRTICLSKLSNEVGFVWSWDGSVRKVTGYGLDYRLRFSSGRGFFSLLPYSGPTTLLPTHCVQRELSTYIKRQERKPDHSFLPRSEVKNSWSFISIPRLTIHGVVLSYGGGGFCLIRGLAWWKNSNIIHRHILIKINKYIK